LEKNIHNFFAFYLRFVGSEFFFTNIKVKVNFEEKREN